MQRPLRQQILLPAAGFLIAAVVINAVFAAVRASQNAARETHQRLEQVGQVLAEASFPRSQPVFDRLRQLTNAEFVIRDTRTGSISVTTLPTRLVPPLELRLPELAGQAAVSQLPLQLDGARYRVSRIDSTTMRGPEQLFVLLPEREIAADQAAAMVPALIVGCLSLLLLIPLMLHVAHRLGTRIATVQRQVAAVAEGSYDLLVDDGQIDDEIHQLLQVVNRMTTRIRELQARIEATERARLLGQLAGGLAHQLRNAITGAKLGVQLHQRRCAGGADNGLTADNSLTVVLKQLSLTEHQLRGLLSLGRQEPGQLTVCAPGEILEEVHELILVGARHTEVEVRLNAPEALPAVTVDRVAVQAAVLNLALNAVEAAGRGGAVELSVGTAGESVIWTVRDTGQGPPAESAGRMFEPFVTTKPEGVGLGLALARQVASDHHGGLHWERKAGWTEFRLVIPLDKSESQPLLHKPGEDS